MKRRILELLRNRETYLSGEEISQSLKISRQASWKHIQELRRMGYEIVAVPHLGYRLIAVPERLNSYELSFDLKTKILAKQIYCYDSVDSTQDIAFAMAQRGAEEGTLICSEGQRKGRGRLGRTWSSPEGLGIYISLILRPPILPNDTPKLTLLAAVACSEAIRDISSLACLIKWPNDLLINNKKVGGILTELNAELDRVNFCILGIGINLNNKKSQLPPRATSLTIEAKRKISRLELLKEMLRRFEELYLTFLKKGFNPILSLCKQLSSTLGARVEVECLSRKFEGVAQDIDQEGALLVRTDCGFVEKVLAGDIKKVR